uniref:Protein kinase C-binding protein 1 n=1 Tax=Clastoptera arizonana TaxID=38151 RepID=A0A1B6CFV5_9HEMI
MEDSLNGLKTISDEPQGKDGSEEQTKDDGVMSQDNNPTTQVDLSENSSAISSNSQIKSNLPPDDVPIIESSSTEKSLKDVDQPVLPRATRSSQNPDFAAKHRKFISSKLKREVDNDSSENISTTVRFVNKDSRKSQEILNENSSGEKRKRNSILSKSTEVNEEISDNEAIVKKKKSFKSDYQPTLVNGEQDSYCWRCHRDGNVMPCETCPRVYHLRCIQLEVAPSRGWVCPECSTVMHAENVDTRSRAMQMLTLDQLCKLLKFAVNRMKGYEGSEEFAKPVDTQQFEHYRNFIIKPMDLSLMEENIKNNLYGSTEAFLADAKWILHNCVIFNSAQSKFTNVARALLKICKQEMLEIENCPDCYQNAHTRSSDSWFIEVCRKPHILVWAKLKGFPFWPAKAMSTNSENQVDVRFFGAHDRAWVPVSACYLYSKMPPVQSSKKKNNLEDCIQELEAHIKKLQDKFGMFQHAPYKTPYNPEEDQLSILLPKFDGKCSPLKRVGRLVLDSISSSSINLISVPQTHNIKRDSNQVRKEKSVENKSNESKLKRRAKPMIRPTIKFKRESNSEKDDDNEASLIMFDESENNSKTLDDSNDLSPSELDMQQNNSNVLIPSSNQTKIACVDKLQEKLSRLSDTNMDQVKQCQENKTVCEASSNDTNCTNIDDLQESLDKNDTDKMKVKPVVVLHDLKNDKILNEHIKKAVEKLESGNQMVLDEHSEEINDNLRNSTDVEEVLQVACSSPSQSVNSNNDVVECESVKKKKNNIDSVVESINRRKSSTEATESDKSMDAPDYTIVKANSSTIGKCNDKNTNKFDSKEPSNDENEVTSTRPDNEKIALDNDYPLTIIDELNEDNMSSSSSVREIPVNSEDSNKILKLCLETLDKPQVDKNRRKGKPAKVCSRSSVDSEENYEDIGRISTESYHNDSNNCSEDQDNLVVLDEVSGKFKNNHKYVVNEKLEQINEQASRTKSSDQESSNVTINVISDESDLNKKIISRNSS